jgi:hypothetical protein
MRVLALEWSQSNVSDIRGDTAEAELAGHEKRELL